MARGILFSCCHRQGLHQMLSLSQLTGRCSIHCSRLLNSSHFVVQLLTDLQVNLISWCCWKNQFAVCCLQVKFCSDVYPIICYCSAKGHYCGCKCSEVLIYNEEHTHTHTFNGSFSGTTQVSRYQRGKNNLDFTEARDSEWQWHQLGHL